ncbi:phage baseplate assembly protein V [Serratia odorifera]|uniref:phage baseplate assembly protein V n=1 Tax=Serratia odorifera TaxID=618 RepID=UPI0012904490|nr:phage baseplate assembly protein V [Serratia odorifera]
MTLEGCLDWQVGDTVTLSHFGHPLDGKAIVTQVEFNCDLNARQGRTIIGVGLDEAAASAPPLVTPSGLMVAKVAPYRTDPRGKSWNRLPVKVPVLGEEIIWARMGHVYASDHSGVTFYPEAGDEVVLGFVGDMPVIMASLHNPQRKAAIEPDEKNAKKGMVLRHQGQRMELSFHRGTGEAVLALGEDKTPEQQLVVDKAKGVAISSLKGDLRADVKAGGAAVTTKKDIALMADEQLLFSGKKDVKLTSDMNMTLAAQETLTGQGKTGVQMESGEGKLALSPESADLSAVQTNVTGKGRVTVQGKEAVDIEGMSIEVKARGNAAISGPRVTVDGTADVGIKAPRVTVDGDMTEVGGTGITQVKGSMINLG